MKTITPPHLIITNLEKLGFENFISYPDNISFLNFQRLISDVEYPEKVVDEIYNNIVGSPERDGKMSLYKLIFDILVLYSIASELDVLASTSLFLKEIDIPNDKTKELKIHLLELLIYGKPSEKKRRKSKINKYLLKVAYQPFLTLNKE